MSLYRQNSRNTYVSLGRCSVVLGSALLSLATGSISPAQAQTRFEWHSSFKLDQARPIDQCAVIFKRIRDSVKAHLPPRDTMPWIPGEDVLEAPPPNAVAAAKRCSETITLASVKDRDLLTAIQIFYMAERHSDARTLISRRLAAIPATDSVQRAFVFDTLVQLYAQVRPVPFAEIDPLLDSINALSSSISWDRRGTTYNSVLSLAKLARDTTLAKKAASLIVQLPNSMTEEEKGAGGFFGSLQVIWQADGYLNDLEIKDSLRKSTEAYVSLMRARWAMFKTGITPLAAELNSKAEPKKWTLPIGMEAPPIQGDWWFPAKPSSPRPTRGKISLITFLTSRCYKTSWCLNVEAVVRRLAKRFPELELTIVSEGTLGFVGPQVFTPEKEAEMQAKWWLDFQRLPGVLAVQKTPFWRLSPPDNRRIDEYHENSKNYSWGGFQAPHISSYLIDENGILILQHDSLREREEELAEYIDILFKRRKTSQQAAR
jgi:hypothetical protein